MRLRCSASPIRWRPWDRHCRWGRAGAGVDRPRAGGGGHHSVVIAAKVRSPAGTLLPIPRRSRGTDGRRCGPARSRIAGSHNTGAWAAGISMSSTCTASISTSYLPRDRGPGAGDPAPAAGLVPAQVFTPGPPRTWLHCVSTSQQAACPARRLLLPFIENGVPLEALRTHVTRARLRSGARPDLPEKGFHLAAEAAHAPACASSLRAKSYGYPEHERYFRNETASAR